MMTLMALNSCNLLSRTNRIIKLNKRSLNSTRLQQIQQNNIQDILRKYETTDFIKQYQRFHGIKTQHQMRQNLIATKLNICVCCKQTYPFYCLELAHVKPKYICDTDFNKYHAANVFFMCRACHNLYDRGFIGLQIDNNKPITSILKYCTKTEFVINDALINQLNNSNISNNSKIYTDTLNTINASLGIDINVAEHSLIISNELKDVIFNNTQQTNSYFIQLKRTYHNTRDAPIPIFPITNAVFNKALYVSSQNNIDICNIRDIREIKIYNIMKLIDNLNYHIKHIFKW
jgi:hypothetical protein